MEEQDMVVDEVRKPQSFPYCLVQRQHANHLEHGLPSKFHKLKGSFAAVRILEVEEAALLKPTFHCLRVD